MSNNKKNKRLSNNVLRIAFCLCLFQAVPASAQIPDTCDADYYDVLRARSYAEGKREMETAQRIILKPDSVLEYSCFNDTLQDLGAYTEHFSETGLNGGNPPPEFNGISPPGGVMTSNNLDNALNTVVRSALIDFLDNFWHTYGGGTFTLSPIPAAGCNPMNVVWQASKCTNFDPSWWVRFEDLATQDIRNYPIPCGEPGRNANISAALAAAFPPPADPVTSGSMNVYTGYVDSVTDCSAAVPIETGISFELSNGTPIDDAVCVVPGCNYDGSSCVSN